ncbi:N-formylglutamate amidohydrolase [Hwangdonia sp.]|uniref:N-formylglutamate amidohydrolase n=1 Tax=Hwangdonia sp. TaxID=1883432 RepID=UPI003AB7F94B
MKLVLTCEHGGNEIPEAYSAYFKNKDVLKTHRGFDLGALDLFQTLKPLADASYFSTTSRLLVELNRSRNHKNLFSEFTKSLPRNEKAEIIKTHYLPYRTAVENTIKTYIENGDSVLHLSIHSFTPVLNNIRRNCDIGLLYDSQKKTEKQFCKQLKAQILRQEANLNIRFNYPYLGKADGFTMYLRKQCPIDYLGIEIEVNQEFVNHGVMDSKLKRALYKALKELY